MSRVGMALSLLAAGCAGASMRAEMQRTPPSAAALRESVADAPLARPEPAVPEGEAGERPAGLPHSAARPAGPEAAPGPPRALGPEDLRFLGVPLSKDLWTRVSSRSWRPPGVVSERTAIVAFLARSERLRSVWLAREASRSRFAQATHLRRLVEQIDAFARRPDNRMAEWPLPDMQSLMGRVVATDVALAGVEFERATLEHLSDLMRTFAEARWLEEVVATRAADKALAERLNAAVGARYAAATASQTALLRAQMRLEDAIQRHRSVVELREAARRKLAALLDLDRPVAAGAWAKLAPVPDAGAARRMAEQSPDVRKAALMLQRGEAMLALAEREVQPDLTPGLSGMRGEVPRRPLPTGYAAGAPYLVELRDRVAALREALAQAKTLVPAQAEQARAHLSDAVRRGRLYRGPQIRLARTSLDSAETQYRAGQIGYAMLDDAWQIWLEVALAGHTAARDAQVTVAELARILGHVPGNAPAKSKGRVQ